MGSRRIMAHSSSGNGRSSNGNDIGGSSRRNGCSYLSNVRPENRSTLCSVMAQLTEDRQPSFETTLKSKAVSEHCNVKLSCAVSGYPTPQVIWYKDDVQLDRYCGLPKYEIFRNGQNHSLHIYDCTMDDAAIYQASASNVKGIVSCSGVLEVGEMNEFKIHQRYFAKIKQKAENRRREAEGKENQEPLRTISPDRSQRKRRSTAEAFRSAPCSTEDNGGEEGHQASAVESVERLQEPTGQLQEESPVATANGVSDGQAVSDNESKGGTYIYDASQKIFKAHPPKSPFLKKKIKMSNSSKVAMVDAQGERASEERKAKTEASISVALSTEELMEVPSSPAILDLHPRNVAENQKKYATEEATYSTDKSICVAPLQNEKISVQVKATNDTSSGITGKQTANCEDSERKGREGNVGLQNHTAQQHGGEPATRKAAGVLELEEMSQTEEVTVMDVDEKSNVSTDGRREHPESVDASCESSAALHQRPCRRSEDQLPEKETSSCQRNASVPRPGRLNEVAHVHTKRNRDNAPVSLELPPDPSSSGTQPPRKTPAGRETRADDIQTPSVRCGLPTAIVKMIQDTGDHSRGSNESHTVLLTKYPRERRSDGGSTRGCHVSHTDQQSIVGTGIKCVEGGEVQVEETVTCCDVDKSEKTESVHASEKTGEMEAVEETRGESVAKDPEIVIVDASNKEKDLNEATIKKKEEIRSESQNEMTTKLEMHQAETGLKPTKELPVEGFHEIQTPVTRVISIAEMLRSQIKDVDCSAANTAPARRSSADFVRHHTAAGKCPEFKGHEVVDIKPGAPVGDSPPKNMKETLMGIYHQLNQVEEENLTECSTSPPVQIKEKPLVIPPVSVIATGIPVRITGPHSTAKKCNKFVTDTVCKAGTSSLSPLKDRPVVSFPESENIKNHFVPVTSLEEVGKQLPPVSNLSANDDTGASLTATQTKASSQEMEIASKNELLRGLRGEFLTPVIKLPSEMELGHTGTLPATTCHLQILHKSPTESSLGPQTQGDSQQETSMLAESSVTVSLTVPNPEASPLLKKRNGASPIPSATPQELASGARRKILTLKAKPKEAPSLAEGQSKETQGGTRSQSPVVLSPSPSFSRRSPLLQPSDERTSSVEKPSPLLSRRKTASDVQPSVENIPGQKTEGRSVEKDKQDRRKAPQVIRKVRAETFADASGHLKLWCQFFNIVCDSTIKWYRNQVEIAELKRNAADESQVNLAIVQASSKDSGVYRCTISNEYGTDATDFQLSTDVMSRISRREDTGVGEEIEMTPLVFSKGVADSGTWGNKFFGRIMIQTSGVGDGCAHKVWRAKVIYGLEPVFESGNMCIIKARNPIVYGGKEESHLMDKNLEFAKQECKIQNLAREYCKIFSAEARAVESFGPSLEVIPVHLMYRPANTVPYATVEADLAGEYQKYVALDEMGRMEMRTGSEVEQKCSSLQHWIFQWTSGNLLLTQLEGVDTKLTNVRITVKSTGHHGLPVRGNPEVFEQFVSEHQCNYFCGLLSLKSLKPPSKPKGSKSPLPQRRMAAGSCSPQTGRKTPSSPRLPRRAEQEGRKTPNTK